MKRLHARRPAPTGTGRVRDFVADLERAAWSAENTAAVLRDVMQRGLVPAEAAGLLAEPLERLERAYGGLARELRELEG